MKCPNCGLFNPESAERCDCGYDFKSNAMEESYVDGKKHDVGKGPVRALKRVLLSLVALLLSGVFIAIWNSIVPPSGITGAMMAVIAVSIVTYTWKWSARLK